VEPFPAVAPSRELSPAYHRGVEGAEPYPLWIKPDKKLSLSDVFSSCATTTRVRIRHDEGRGRRALRNAERNRPITWEVKRKTRLGASDIDAADGFSFVSQSRSQLPNAVAGAVVRGDDTYTTCYVPLYCCIDSFPGVCIGRLEKFSWDSAWWVCNSVANSRT